VLLLGSVSLVDAVGIAVGAWCSVAAGITVLVVNL
jgi:hypothetical protein